MQWELQKKAGFGFKESYGDKLKSKVFDPISKFYKKKLMPNWLILHVKTQMAPTN